MEERLKETVLEMPIDLDRFFPTGYVIELGEGVYYREHKGGKILCSVLAGAELFQRKEDAEQFAHRYLGYVDMETYLCEVGWVLLSVEGEAMELEQYWDGCRFTSDLERALVFSSYQEISSCQKRGGLQDASMIDLRTFRRKQIMVAA